MKFKIKKRLKYIIKVSGDKNKQSMSYSHIWLVSFFYFRFAKVDEEKATFKCSYLIDLNPIFFRWLLQRRSGGEGKGGIERKSSDSGNSSLGARWSIHILSCKIDYEKVLHS